MADKKISDKVFLENLGDLTAEKGVEMENKRQAMLKSIADTNARRAAKNAEKHASEDAPVIEGIKNALADGAKFSTEIVVEGYKTAKIVAVANKLVKAGELTVERAINDKGDVRNKYTLA